MIPHHSMAVHMSRKLLEKGVVKDPKFLENIIDMQDNEINKMKM
jgi:uncharacterized protein (DUF305 family)